MCFSSTFSGLTCVQGFHIYLREYEHLLLRTDANANLYERSPLRTDANANLNVTYRISISYQRSAES